MSVLRSGGIFSLDAASDVFSDESENRGLLAQLVARMLRTGDCMRSWVQLPQSPYILSASFLIDVCASRDRGV
jgi:hypothetical protein